MPGQLEWFIRRGSSNLRRNSKSSSQFCQQQLSVCYLHSFFQQQCKLLLHRILLRMRFLAFSLLTHCLKLTHLHCMQPPLLQAGGSRARGHAATASSGGSHHGSACGIGRATPAGGFGAGCRGRGSGSSGGGSQCRAGATGGSWWWCCCCSSPASSYNIPLSSGLPLPASSCRTNLCCRSSSAPAGCHVWASLCLCCASTSGPRWWRWMRPAGSSRYRRGC